MKDLKLYEANGPVQTYMMTTDSRMVTDQKYYLMTEKQVNLIRMTLAINTCCFAVVVIIAMWFYWLVFRSGYVKVVNEPPSSNELIEAAVVSGKKAECDEKSTQV